jgi:hypothetical protein
MQTFSIDIEWFQCPDGYRLVPRGSISKGDPPMDRIVASSDRSVAYRPFDGFDSLYKEFAKVKTADDLLGFVKRFGLLEKGSEWDADFDGEYPVAAWKYEGNSVPKYLAQARLFRDVLLRKQNGPKAVAAFIRSHKEEFGGKVVSHLALVADPTTGIKLAVAPIDLIHGLKYQLVQSLIGSTIIRVCRYCGAFFEAGPGGKVRSDATFCCHEHSVLYHSHKRSKGDR